MLALDCHYRRIVAGLLLLLLSNTLTLTASAELPEFVRHDLAIDPGSLIGAPLNFPHNDAIFPSVIDASAHYASPLGKYYMYYGPHDSPGGIYMAHSNSLNGPWTQYDADPADADLDPVIARTWTGAYNVSHVASPDAEWIPEESKMFLWFHGENTQTRYASSIDGLHFNYEGVAVDTADFNGVSEVSYARISREAAPERGAKYVMTAMGNNGGTRKAYLAWSPDGRNWTTQPDPLLTPHLPAANDPQIASPELLEWNGKKYIAYHQDSLAGGNPTAELWATPITNNFEVAGPPELLFESLPGEDVDRVASPYFIRDDEELHMFYDSGSRLHNKIRHATAPLPTVDSSVLPLEGLPVAASSGAGSLGPASAIDGDVGTRWSGAATSNQWFTIDLGEERLLEQLKIDWHSSNARDYAIYTSTGAAAPNPATALAQWDMIAKVTGRGAMPIGGDADGLNGAGGGNADDLFDFVNGSFTDLGGVGLTSTLVAGNASSLAARYLMVYANTRATSGGASIWEMELTHSILSPPTPELKLAIDRATGKAAIVNATGEPIDVVGYSITSGTGVLSTSQWLSLADQANADWREANPTPHSLSELKPTPSTLVAPSASLHLGKVFSPATVYGGSLAPFGVNPQDNLQLEFEYATPDGNLLSGEVEYQGKGLANNLVLLVDPASGSVQFENNSLHTVSLIGYDVASASGSLDPAQWASLDDQLLAGWTESNPSASRLAELTFASGTVLGSGEILTLGQLFSESAGVQDLVFSFLLDGESAARRGIVQYGALEALTPSWLNGDFDDDGDVDGSDFLTWQQELGPAAAVTTAADGNGDGCIDGIDLGIWRSNFGAATSAIYASTAAVPEPAGVLLALTAVAGLGISRRTRV